MLKTLVILVGFVMVFHTTAMTTPPTKSLKSRLLESKSLPDATSRPGSDHKKASEGTVYLAKEEVEIDKEINKEILRRKNATSVILKILEETVNSTPKTVKETVNSTPKTVKETANVAGKQCDKIVDLGKPGSLALCTCDVDEVLVNGTCTHYSSGTSIDGENLIMQKQITPVSNYRVKVQDLECSDENAQQNFTFEKGQFYLRNRGDIVLTDTVEHLAGLRISDYCINYYLDEGDSLTWQMKACVPYPSVPRCCPTGQLLRNGTCHTGPSPDHLLPPIQAKPRTGNAVNWTVINSHVNTLNCGESETLRTVALDIQGSYLLALPKGLAYRWHPSDSEEHPRYMFCPDFCVDGRQGVDGSINYLASFCHAAPVYHKETCKTETCIQKCCNHGEILSIDHYRCIKVEGASLNLPVSGNISDYEIIVARPRCTIHLSDLKDVVIDSEGNLHNNGFTMPTTDYCIDTFAKQGVKNTEVLFCPRAGASFSRTWYRVRPILFPVCHVISLFFLGITVVFYFLAPVLLKQEGWHQLSYVLSLMLAYGAAFSVNVYHPAEKRCVAIALIMQYGFLATFFWLCVMCFDIEGKIRSLKNFRAYINYHNLAYVAFGFGCPLLITVITLIVQTQVPYGTPGVIQPSLAVSKCWFHDDWGLLVYFYGPIAVLCICNIALIASTAWNYKKIEKGALGIMMNSPSENYNSSSPPLEYDRQKQTKKRFAEFKHKFLLMSLMCFCWLTEILSWKIPPPEIWAFTDVLNCLQGFFIFVIFLSNRRNRKTLKKRHPWLFSVFQPLKNVFQKLRGIFFKNRQNLGSSASEDAVGRSREPSISSEYSDLSDNNKPPEPAAS